MVRDYTYNISPHRKRIAAYINNEKSEKERVNHEECILYTHNKTKREKKKKDIESDTHVFHKGPRLIN